MGSVGIFVLEVVLKIMAYSAFTGKKAFFKVRQAGTPSINQHHTGHRTLRGLLENKALT